VVVGLGRRSLLAGLRKGAGEGKDGAEEVSRGDVAFDIGDHLGNVAIEEEGFGAALGAEELGKLVQGDAVGLVELGNGKDNPAIVPDTHAVAMKFVGGVPAEGVVDFVLVQKKRARLDGDTSVGGQALVFRRGDDMGAGGVDVEDTVGLEIEVALAIPEVKRTEGLASDDEEAAGRAVFLEEAAVHHEIDAAVTGLEVLLECAELAEGPAMVVFPIEFDLRRFGDLDVEGDAAPFDAFGGVR